MPRHRVALRRLCLAAVGFSAFACSPLLRAQATGGGGAGGAGGINAGNIGNIIRNLPPGTNLGDIVGTLPGNFNLGNLNLGNLTGLLGGNTATTSPTIVTTAGVLTGDSATAAVVVPGQAAAAPSGGTTADPSANSYQWTISGGKITSATNTATVTYVADRAGTVILSVHVVANSTTYDVQTTVTAISAADAGTISAPATAAMGTATITASVPPAVNGDRTFRWTVTGDAAITAGATTNNATVRPGTSGVKQLTCAVTLQKLVTVNVRSYLVVTGNGPTVNVAVNGGYGGGTWPGGSKVDVFANPPPPGQVFDKWTGDTAVLGTGPLATALPHALITVPNNSIALTATYKPAPTWTPTTLTNFNPQTQTNPQTQVSNTLSTTLAYYIPADARGLVFLLHDTGGRAADWFTLPEQSLLVRDLVAAGYGVAALSSVNRNTGAWSAAAKLENNLDALNHAAALDRFAALAASKSVFFLGLADGGDTALQFASLLATASPARPVKGAVLFCAAGSETLAVTSKVPQFFALAANDENLGTAGLTTARTNSQLLAGRGYATGTMTSAATPVLPGRFLALSSATAADATAIHSALKSAGLLDANNYLTDLPTADALKTALPAAYQARTAEVAAELAAAYADAQIYSDADARIIAFLNARVADTPAPTPGRLINLSTRTVVAYAGDSFALGFNIGGGAEKATLLIRGVGPTLKAFGLDTAIPALRLEVNPAGSQTPLASNEGWDKPAPGGATAAQITAAAASVGAFQLPAGSADTALLLQLAPGSYTVNLKGLNGTTGDVLAEVYDVSKNATRLTNLSTLAKINNTGDLLIPGIVVAGANPRTLMVRAIGPGLADFGITTYLGNPRIAVLTTGANNTTTTVATNTNWAGLGVVAGTAGAGALSSLSQQATLTAAFPLVGAFPLKTTNADAALITALTPANYTLQAGAAPVGANQANPPSQTGSVLVEVYEVP
jgi:hypothetical protein